MITPSKLIKGDRVALLAPSGPCDHERIPLAARALEGFGFIPHEMESCRSRHGYFAGSDNLRAKDILDAFADPEIKGIFALRGGYGAQRLLPLLDYNIIGKHPKIFAGYSDITALHTVFNQRCGFVTYHAPMAGTDLHKPAVDNYTRDSFRGHMIEGHTPPKLSYTILVPGSATGTLTGGNLSLLVSSLGTPYEINTCGKILFIEEIDEAPYRIDRMLLQLKQAGKLTDCRAILLGSFLPETIKTISQAIEEILIPLDKPVGINLPCGHCLPTATLPLGAKIHMNAGIVNYI